MNGNHWRIQIGVTLAGELLIGAAKIRAAEDGDGVAETATIWPSQLEHRCAAHVAKLLFDPEKKGDRWILLTPREAYMRQEAGNVDLIRRFPAARGNLSIRRRKDVK